MSAKIQGGTSIKIFQGATTYDLSTASGIQVISGVGFKPKAIMFMAGVNNSMTVCMGFAVDQAADGDHSFQSQDFFSADTWNILGASCLALKTAAFDDQFGNVSVYGPDGFTINWVKVGSPTGTGLIKYTCFG